MYCPKLFGIGTCPQINCNLAANFTVRQILWIVLAQGDSLWSTATFAHGISQRMHCAWPRLPLAAWHEQSVTGMADCKCVRLHKHCQVTTLAAVLRSSATAKHPHTDFFVLSPTTFYCFNA